MDSILTLDILNKIEVISRASAVSEERLHIAYQDLRAAESTIKDLQAKLEAGNKQRSFTFDVRKGQWSPSSPVEAFTAGGCPVNNCGRVLVYNNTLCDEHLADKRAVTERQETSPGGDEDEEDDLWDEGATDRAANELQDKHVELKHALDKANKRIAMLEGSLKDWSKTYTDLRAEHRTLQDKYDDLLKIDRTIDAVKAAQRRPAFNPGDEVVIDCPENTYHKVQAVVLEALQNGCAYRVKMLPKGYSLIFSSHLLRLRKPAHAAELRAIDNMAAALKASHAEQASRRKQDYKPGDTVTIYTPGEPRDGVYATVVGGGPTVYEVQIHSGGPRLQYGYACLRPAPTKFKVGDLVTHEDFDGVCTIQEVTEQTALILSPCKSISVLVALKDLTPVVKREEPVCKFKVGDRVTSKMEPGLGKIVKLDLNSNQARLQITGQVPHRWVRIDSLTLLGKSEEPAGKLRPAYVEEDIVIDAPIGKPRKKAKKPSKRAKYRKWTAYEDSQLRALVETDGRNLLAASKLMKRSQSMVYRKAEELGLRPKKGKT